MVCAKEESGNAMIDYDVKGNLAKIRSSLPEGVALVAVSKFHGDEYLLEAYDEGQRIFGESQEQELRGKHERLPKDIEWHFIGHLQTNKVKYIAPYITMIEAVDSIKLMREINRQAAKHNRTIDILLELRVANEETKFGLLPEEMREMLAEGEWRTLENVRIRGLMTMASFTDDESQIRNEFTIAANMFDEIKARYFADADFFDCRSWGMSDDYHVACQCNSNMVRIGTTIFGPRTY